MQTLIIFPVKVSIFRSKAMMDNTPAKKCRKPPKITQKLSHPAAIFSVYLRKCMTNGGRYILSQGTEENSNAICSLCLSFLRVYSVSLVKVEFCVQTTVDLLNLGHKGYNIQYWTHLILCRPNWQKKLLSYFYFRETVCQKEFL